MATVFAFEPISEIYKLLEKTIALNDAQKVVPCKKGLADKVTEIDMNVIGMTGSTFVMDAPAFGKKERVSLTTIDKFVEENNLNRVDFIKADIEGAERYMLKGATRVLKEFAPKLAICTYHLKDDPEVISEVIKEANPRYKIVQR